MYNTTPLSKVFEDVERQYNIRIDVDIQDLSKYHYTGLFNRNVQAEEALEIICYSFDLTFEKADSSDVTGRKIYVIKESE